MSLPILAMPLGARLLPLRGEADAIERVSTRTVWGCGQYHEYQVSDQSLTGVYVFFPDPWPKKRHHKRRLMGPEFVATLRRKLRSHARVFLATDWDDYARHIVQVMDADGGFVNLAGRAVYAPRPHWRPLTRYELRAHARGHRIRELLYALT